MSRAASTGDVTRLTLVTVVASSSGLLRPLIIYPSEMVYWYTLPMVAVFQMLHFEKDKQQQRVKMFCYLFCGTLLWEPIVAYIAPWLNGISLPCIASMHAPMPVSDEALQRCRMSAQLLTLLGLWSPSG